ncbi:hypothetical protein YC2023_022879 [Brassica napus]
MSPIESNTCRQLPSLCFFHGADDFPELYTMGVIGWVVGKWHLSTLFQSFDRIEGNDNRYVQLCYLPNWYLQYCSFFDKLLALLLTTKKTKDKLDFNKKESLSCQQQTIKKKKSQTTNKTKEVANIVEEKNVNERTKRKARHEEVYKEKKQNKTHLGSPTSNPSLSTTTFPRSPLSFISPHSLSHLKLSSPKLVTPTSLRTDDDDDEDDMSISSGSDAVGGGGLSDYDLDDDEVVRRYYDEEEVFGPTKPTSKSNRGVLNDKNLRIEVPFANRRVTDGESRLRRFAMANSTPGSYLRDERPHTLSSKGSVYWDSNEDIGTPSAPPIMDIGEDDNIAELEKEIEHIEDEICREAGVESHHQQLNIGCIAVDDEGFLSAQAAIDAIKGTM